MKTFGHFLLVVTFVVACIGIAQTRVRTEYIKVSPAGMTAPTINAVPRVDIPHRGNDRPRQCGDGVGDDIADTRRRLQLVAC